VNAPNVTLTLDAMELCQLFAGGNRTFPNPDPLALALDIIEQAADTLQMVHDALIGTPDNSQEIASYAWRMSRQLAIGMTLVEALKKSGGAT